MGPDILRPLDRELEAAPAPLDHGEIDLPILEGPSTRVSVPLEARCRGAHADERRGSFGVRGREHGAQAEPVLEADEERSFRARGIHHGADVVHPRLEAHPFLADDAVRQAGATAVEQDHTAERRESPEDVGPRLRPKPPDDVDVEHEARAEEEVLRPLTEHLVRDMDPVRGDRVPGLGGLWVSTCGYSAVGGCAASRDLATADRLTRDGGDLSHRGGEAGARRSRPWREGRRPCVADAGFEVDLHRPAPDPRDDRRAALQEDVDAVGLSIPSGAHMTLFPKAVMQLQEPGGGRHPRVRGRRGAEGLYP